MTTLFDKYTKSEGKIFLSGIQAMIRLLLLQKEMDEQNGLKTGGYVSGYRGSPLGGLDKNLWQNEKILKDNDIHFEPGLNEDLAATALWGTQQIDAFQDPAKAKYDGVFGLWYGKGPGVDRSGDAFKHANIFGTSEYGGVLLAAGDDHPAKSSTFPHQSEQSLIASFIPMLNPANVQDILDLGLYGWALSRFSGLWTGFKIITENADASASIEIRRPKIIIPKFDFPADGINFRWPDTPEAQEERIITYKLPAVQAFVKANDLDKVIFKSKKPRLSIITTGKSYIDTLQALDDLWIGQQKAKDIGISLYKVAVTWPLETSKLHEFIKDSETVLVIEEKRSLIESQLKDSLYNTDIRVPVIGKHDKNGSPLLPETYELNPQIIAKAIADLISSYHTSDQITARLETIQRKTKLSSMADAKRLPHYCSGCPHNTSTKVPEGSKAIAGIGCHYMATWIYPDTVGFTHMGGEGIPWLGQSKFSSTDHVFANLGDGTYNHSGSLAIRAALASDANITYKILFNDAVAMTGGQPLTGELTSAKISHQVYHEGVRNIVVVADDLERLDKTDYAFGVTFFNREFMPKVQEDMTKMKGVSVLIYDQMCATELRRKRKRGIIPDPKKRIFINELVCEGCGDCNLKSNCLSVVPVDTEFGGKRQIDQHNCNKDFSCVNGFCPSFVTLEGVDIKKPQPKVSGDIIGTIELDKPKLPSINSPYNILIAGVGGTGVVSVSAILGMAAHIEDKGVSVLDQTGLAQKFGEVLGHLRISNKASKIHAPRISSASVDLLIGSDIMVSSSKNTLDFLSSDRTTSVINTKERPTGDIVYDAEWRAPTKLLKADIKKSSMVVNYIDATDLSVKLVGNDIVTNLLLVGYAYQEGLMPISQDAIFKAIELNGAAIDDNKKAFLWGRALSASPEKVIKAANPIASVKKSLEQRFKERVKFLTDYQNEAYSQRYINLISRVWLSKFSGEFAEAVTLNMFKLMAYKDEYEVARLYAHPDFSKQIDEEFDGKAKMTFYLAPPLFSKKDPLTGLPMKSEYGSWVMPVFKLLAKMKFLRGTAFDIFGYTAERKMERLLVERYERLILDLVDKFDTIPYDKAVALAKFPEIIKGYGHIKEANIDKALKVKQKLLEEISL